MRAEPPLRDRGARDLPRRAGAKADDEAPHEIQVPELAHVDQREQAGADEQDAAGEKLSRPESLEEPAPQRSAEAEREQRQADREGDRGAIPAELLLERNDDHAGRRTDRLRRHERDERHRDNDPCVMEAADLHRHSSLGKPAADKLAPERCPSG